MKPKANLFLIGAAKSGTTSLAATLAKHPAIAPLPIKEPGHFSTDLRTPVFSSRYNRLLQWDEAAYFKKAPLEERHIGFVESELNYQKLVNQALTSNPDSKYVLDASTAYLYSAKRPGSTSSLCCGCENCTAFTQPYRPRLQPLHDGLKIWDGAGGTAAGIQT